MAKSNMLEQTFIEAVYERDIDLLLLEELHVSPAFRLWLTEQVPAVSSESLEFMGAWHSLTEVELGESDLVLLQRTSDGSRQAILIENKIDAIAQPRQATRYLQRGQAGIDKGYWDAFQTCLIAPQRYLNSAANAKRYQAQLPYEAIRDWFREEAAQAEEAARLDYKIRLLSEAIEQNRRGYQPIPNEAVTRFWHQYWECVQDEFHELDMRRPGEKPANADWPEFRNPEFEGVASIVHKWRFGYVDLQIGGRADQVDELRPINQRVLDDGVEIVKASKSAAFRIQVPKIDRFASFDDQIDDVRLGLNAAVRLLDVFPRIRGL